MSLVLFKTLIVYKGWFRKKRYYRGWAQNAHNMESHAFMIDADWFDTLTDELQLKTFQREYESAYKTSIVLGGGYE